jgi:hypothetical protein
MITGLILSLFPSFFLGDRVILVAGLHTGIFSIFKDFGGVEYGLESPCIPSPGLMQEHWDFG